MSNSQDNQLERLLTDWANKTSSSADDLESLKVSIVDQLDEDSSPAVELVSLLESRNRWRIVAGIATAAMLLVALGTWYRLEPNGGQEPLTQALAQYPHPLPVDTVSTDHQKRRWQEYYRVFGSQLAWIADRDGQAEIGLTDPSKQSNSEELIAIRLILWSRPENGGQWQETQTCQVMAGHEQMVQVVSSESDSAPLEIWAYPIDEKMISIDLRYQPNVPEAKLVDESVLQRIGEHTEVCSFEKDGVEYRLYQTADLIVNNDLG